MNAKMHIDSLSPKPLLSVESETLSDQSQVWNLNFNGVVIPMRSERHADKCFDDISSALGFATDEVIKTF